MTALEIIGMILLLFLLLSLLRVGVIVDFGGELRVRLRVGPVKLTVLPRKEKKAQKKAAEAAGKTPEEKTKPKAAGGHRLPKLSFPELRELAGTVLGALKRTLRRTCRRTRIDPLEVGVIFAGDDPADTAQTYGYANAALWTLMPKLCDLFAILFTLAVPVGKWFLRWRRAHGGEAKAEPPAERAAVPKTNEPEKRTA